VAPLDWGSSMFTCSSCGDPVTGKEFEDYMALNGGALILCECCVVMIANVAKQEGMLPSTS
jgi:hypothetical protein